MNTVIVVYAISSLYYLFAAAASLLKWIEYDGWIEANLCYTGYDPCECVHKWTPGRTEEVCKYVFYRELVLWSFGFTAVTVWCIFLKFLEDTYRIQREQAKKAKPD